MCLAALVTVMWNNYAKPMMAPLPYLWSEGAVLFYNTVENKSSNWGTSPPHWYLVALAKSFLGTLPFLALGIVQVSPRNYVAIVRLNTNIRPLTPAASLISSPATVAAPAYSPYSA